MPITAIIPTIGDRPQMLDRAVSSVKNQDFPVEELIIVVDGSEDHKAQIIRRHREASVVKTRGSMGVSTARNLGAREARTPFLAFLDDDDVWKGDYLASAMKDGQGFDVTLTAFEKHKPRDIVPEKIPPEALEAQRFLVANPGLRGSNLIIRREVYLRVGGFDEQLPAFNDMDFGIRLSDSGPWRYRRNVRHLVEFHCHAGPRLSTPGGEANRAGMVRFWEKHSPRMTPAQQDAFRKRALKIWDFDPVQRDEVDVHLVGLGPANDPKWLPRDVRRFVSQCKRVFYPGDWVGKSLREAFGERLVWGRDLKTADILSTVAEAQHSGGSIAVLYNGDGRLFSGRHGCFASLGELEARLIGKGVRVKTWPGIGSAQAALDAAGWQIPALPGVGLMTAAPLCRGPEGCEELRQAARCPAVLALLWCEDHAGVAYEVLLDERGAEVPIALVMHLGHESQNVVQGKLGTLSGHFEALEPPSVILVAQSISHRSGGWDYVGPQGRCGGEG